MDWKTYYVPNIKAFHVEFRNLGCDDMIPVASRSGDGEGE